MLLLLIVACSNLSGLSRLIIGLGRMLSGSKGLFIAWMLVGIIAGRGASCDSIGVAGILSLPAFCYIWYSCWMWSIWALAAATVGEFCEFIPWDRKCSNNFYVSRQQY